MKLEAESVKADSIFAVLDNEKRGERSPPPDGHWSEYSTVAERDFRFAAAAKLVITKSGYFLVGMVRSKDGAYLVLGQLEGNSGRRVDELLTDQTHDRGTLAGASRSLMGAVRMRLAIAPALFASARVECSLSFKKSGWPERGRICRLEESRVVRPFFGACRRVSDSPGRKSVITRAKAFARVESAALISP